MNVKRLACIIESWSRPSELRLDEADVYSWLTRPLDQLKHPRNAALDAGTSTNGSWIIRIAPLDPAIEIEGDFLLINYVPHGPFLQLWTFDRIEEVEAYLVSQAGPLNKFCECAVPLIKGTAWDYCLHFSVDGRAEEYHFPGEVERTEAAFFRGTNRRIEWKSATRL